MSGNATLEDEKRRINELPPDKIEKEWFEEQSTDEQENSSDL